MKRGLNPTFKQEQGKGSITFTRLKTPPIKNVPRVGLKKGGELKPLQKE